MLGARGQAQASQEVMGFMEVRLSRSHDPGRYLINDFGVVDPDVSAARRPSGNERTDPVCGARAPPGDPSGITDDCTAPPSGRNASTSGPGDGPANTLHSSCLLVQHEETRLDIVTGECIRRPRWARCGVSRHWWRGVTRQSLGCR
jgi:hypothetical protein